MRIEYIFLKYIYLERQCVQLLNKQQNIKYLIYLYAETRFYDLFINRNCSKKKQTIFYTRSGVRKRNEKNGYMELWIEKEN